MWLTMVCNVFQHFFATFMDQIQRPQFSVAILKPQNCLVINEKAICGPIFCDKLTGNWISS